MASSAPQSAWRRGGHCALAVAAALYAGLNVTTQLALCEPNINPLTLALAREILAAPLLYLLALASEKKISCPSRDDAAKFAALGALLSTFQLCFIFGIKLTDANTAALFQAIEPTTAAIFGAAICLEKLTPAKVASALLAGAGVIILIHPPSHSGEHHNHTCGASHHGSELPGKGPRSLGCLLLFGQGLGISAYCLLQKSLVRRKSYLVNLCNERYMPSIDSTTSLDSMCEDVSIKPSPYDACRRPLSNPILNETLQPTLLNQSDRQAQFLYGPVTVTAHAYCTSIVILSIVASLPLSSSPALSWSQMSLFQEPAPLIALLYSVIFASVIGYSLRAWANRHVDASTLVLYNALQPPLTSILGWLMDPEHTLFGWRKLAGSALVLLALCVCAASNRVRIPCVRRRARRLS